MDLIYIYSWLIQECELNNVANYHYNISQFPQSIFLHIQPILNFSYSS